MNEHHVSETFFTPKQAVLKGGEEDTYRAVLRVLRKRLVRLPTVDPAPDQVTFATSREFYSVSFVTKATRIDGQASKAQICAGSAICRAACEKRFLHRFLHLVSLLESISEDADL